MTFGAEFFYYPSNKKVKILNIFAYKNILLFFL